MVDSSHFIVSNYRHTIIKTNKCVVELGASTYK